ncbi:MAG: nucleotidyltransferase family protein, partial [Hyphomicrobium sp.]|nr:nucleotidyltransferase family protein [Hyphomicrobium sp.]
GANRALLLAGHGTKQVWKLLKWVRDIALMIDRHRDLDWSAIHRRALGQGCGDSVLLGCAMAQELLDVAPPGALAALVMQSDRVRARALSLAGRMRAGHLPSSEGENFVDLELCDRRLDRIKGALSLAFTPTPGDYAALKLPPALWGAYYATRPFRLAFKAVAGNG